MPNLFGISIRVTRDTIVRKAVSTQPEQSSIAHKPPATIGPASGHNFVSQHQDTYGFIDPVNADLSGKHIMVTGASRGIGKAVAISFCKAGVSGIAIAARSDLSEIRRILLSAASDAGRAEPQILMLRTDTTNNDDVEAAAKEVDAQFGKLDILVNNAGYLDRFAPIAESDPDNWWKTFEVNVKGVYQVSRAFLPLLLRSESKTIVQMSSIGAVITTPGGSAYETTKQAVLRLNNYLMRDYGDQGLLAFGIHPGGVLTELASVLPKEILANLVDKPELAGDTIVWLTKEKRNWLADRYISAKWDMEEFAAKETEIVKKDLLKVKLRI